MDIPESLSRGVTEFDIGAPLSKVAGAFENQELDAVVVTDGEEQEPLYGWWLGG